MTTRVLLDAAGLVALAGVIGLVHSVREPIRLTLEAGPVAVSAAGPAAAPGSSGAGGEPARAVGAASSEAEPAWMIHTARALELYQQAESQGDVFFVDARNAEEFVAGHIPGAFSVPPDAFFGGQYPGALDQIPKFSTVVVYCGGGACDASKLVAIRFREAGFERVLVYQDGFTGWSAEKLPSQAGDLGGAAGGGS